MSKVNCWEAKQCGRQPGGAKVAELGECPAATAYPANGVNGGRAGGRVCWAVTGTFCGGKVQGTFAEKRASCLSCEFFSQVKQEEGGNFCLSLPAAAGQA